MKYKNLLKAQKRFFMMHLKNHRIELELNQQELAKITGLSQATIAQLESGRKMPSIETMIKLASAFNIRPSEFLVY